MQSGLGFTMRCGGTVKGPCKEYAQWASLWGYAEASQILDPFEPEEISPRAVILADGSVRNIKHCVPRVRLQIEELVAEAKIYLVDAEWPDLLIGYDVLDALSLTPESILAHHVTVVKIGGDTPPEFDEVGIGEEANVTEEQWEKFLQKEKNATLFATEENRKKKFCDPAAT